MNQSYWANGPKIRWRREKLDLTRAQLAEKTAEVDPEKVRVSKETINNAEKGQRISAKCLNQIAKALGLAFEDTVDWERHGQAPVSLPASSPTPGSAVSDGITWFGERSNADEPWQRDLQQFEKLVFLGISQSSLVEHLRNVFAAGNGPLPWRLIEVYFAHDDVGKIFESDFKHKLKESRLAIAIELTDPAWSHRTQNLETIVFRQCHHLLPPGGCMLGKCESEDNPFQVVYGIQYLPTAKPDANKALAYRIDAQQGPGGIAQKLMEAHVNSYRAISSSSDAKCLGNLSPSVWDRSVKRWSEFCHPGSAQCQSMRALVEFAEFRGNELVIDLAAGSGETSQVLLQAIPNGRLTVLEASPQMLRHAKEVLRECDTVRYALCRVPTEHNGEDIDLQHEYDAILIHLSLPALAGSIDAIQELARWCHRRLNKRGQVLLCVHDRVVEVGSSTVASPADSLRDSLVKAAETLHFTKYIDKQAKPSFSQKEIEVAFTNVGLSHIRKNKMIDKFEIDRWALWSVPAILKELFFVDVMTIEEIDRLIQTARDMCNDGTALRSVVCWSFSQPAQRG